MKLGDIWQKASEEENASHAVCPPSTTLCSILSASVVDIALPSQLSHVLLHEGG